MRKITLILVALVLSVSVFSQTEKKKKIVKNGSFYFSWGYNGEWYTHSDIHISQPALNNNFSFLNVTATDHKGWDHELFSKALTIPQYNYRFGYFFNEKQDWGLEINFDHTKYVLDWGQPVHEKGTINGKSVDTTVAANGTSIIWMLNNGANFLQLNLVKKFKLLDVWNSKLQIDFLAKAGAGPVIPHVENTILGQDNIPHFQFGGWNADLDGSFRVTVLKHVFLEYQSKVVYGRYFHLHVYEGLADQHFGCFEMALVLGGTFKF
jgi:hypothetical protein